MPWLVVVGQKAPVMLEDSEEDGGLGAGLSAWWGLANYVEARHHWMQGVEATLVVVDARGDMKCFASPTMTHCNRTHKSNKSQYHQCRSMYMQCSNNECNSDN